MTTEQMIAVAALAAAAIYNFYPQLISSIELPGKKSQLLQDLETVVRIRKTYESEKVTAACKALLEALLGVKR